FIRPQLEYGLSLTMVPKEALSILQKAQNNILRRIVSGHRSTSINALHKLLLIEKIELRNASLSIRFADKLHNCTD
ncbi:hypothetical protein ROZALSC1DRAFT_7599, partial [Rozella allomycis CSF55]